jgi:hypothetical protein
MRLESDFPGSYLREENQLTEDAKPFGNGPKRATSSDIYTAWYTRPGFA